MGITREQVIDRLGEPRSVITAGNREILFFPRERVVLRGGVVIEVEPLASDTPAPAARRPAAPTPAPAAAEPVRPATPPAPMPISPEAAANPTSTEIAKNLPADMPPVAAPTVPEGPPPALEIKSVRPKGAATRPAPKQETPAPAPAPVAETPKAEPAPVAPPPAPATRGGKQAPRPPTAEELAAKAEADAKKEKSRLLRRRLDDANLEEPDENVITGSTYVIAFVIIGGGIGYLLWQRSQRQIELAATAVSRTPFNAPASSSGTGARFTADFLGKLEWKRFEELVAAYYTKTGVVSARTKTGPASPVHIKISWKGEPRPFACVQCIAHPDGLVEAARLQELVTVLAAEDIRRGYVVTTGKFSVAARDLAEEKHLTLLPGDIFLEKLNALPDAARGELMQETTAGDYTTPSCPKCDAKMVRSPDDSSQWRCDTHRDQTIQA